MRATLAIAFLTIRGFVRSRLFAVLAGCLALILIGLPLTLKGDGTLAGHVRLLLHYALGLTSVLLAVSTIWTSCETLAQEVEDRQIQMMVAKPVHAAQIWLGKWLGVMSVNAVLLLLAGLGLTAFLRWNLASSWARHPEKAVVMREILVGRRRIAPRPEPIDEETQAVWNRMQKEGTLPPGVPPNEVLDTIRKRLLSAKSVVPPGQSKRWVFDMPPLSARSTPILRFTLRSVQRDRSPVSGVWMIGADEDPTRFRAGISNYLDGVHSLPVPAAALAESRTTTLVFANEDRDRSNLAVFEGAGNVDLLLPEIGFEGNLLRALVIAFFRLGVMAAIGLTAGALFSLPVAAFTTAGLVAMAMLVQSLGLTVPETTRIEVGHEVVAAESRTPVLQAAGERLAQALVVIVRPAMQASPFEQLSDGILIPASDLRKALVFLAILYPGFLGWAGSACLRRRELALPG